MAPSKWVVKIARIGHDDGTNGRFAFRPKFLFLSCARVCAFGV
jgi:hypothetical protein